MCVCVSLFLCLFLPPPPPPVSLSFLSLSLSLSLSLCPSLSPLPSQPLLIIIYDIYLESPVILVSPPPLPPYNTNPSQFPSERTALSDDDYHAELVMQTVPASKPHAPCTSYHNSTRADKPRRGLFFFSLSFGVRST